MRLTRHETAPSRRTRGKVDSESLHSTAHPHEVDSESVHSTEVRAAANLTDSESTPTRTAANLTDSESTLAQRGRWVRGAIRGP